MIYIGKPLKVSIFDNRSLKLSMAKVKAKTGADIVLNGSLFNWSDYSPCCDIRVGGKTLNDDQYSYFGYGWNNGELPRVMNSNDMFTVDNYISCIWAIHSGEKQPLNDNASGIGGTRGRTAFGFKASGEMVILCTSDSNGALKLSQARDKLFDTGCVSGIILDGGGSSQIDSPTEDVISSRIVSNFICVWIGKPAETKGSDKMKVCLDPGHGTREMNQSPDGTYIEHEFALDMANRIRKYLVACEVDAKLTREDSSTPSLTERATIANNYGADLYVSLHSNATGGEGWNDTAHGLTVWTYAEGGKRDVAANLLLKEMAAVGIETFGSKLYHSKFAVLAKSNMPAYLVEYAFHTCHSDVLLLKSDTHRDKLAKATAKAICAYGGVKWVEALTYKVQIDLTDETKAEQLTAELAAKGYKSYITTEVIK